MNRRGVCLPLPVGFAPGCSTGAQTNGGTERSGPVNGVNVAHGLQRAVFFALHASRNRPGYPSVFKLSVISPRSRITSCTTQQAL